MRVLLRVLSPLLALVMAAAGALLAIEVVAGWSTSTDAGLLLDWPAWLAALEQRTWRSSGARWAAGGLAAVGLVLVVIALAGRRQDIELTGPAPDVTVTTTPGALARLVRQRVADVDGVQRTSVAASPRMVSVRAQARVAAAEALLPVVRDRVDGVLAALRPARPPKVTVRVDAARTRPATPWPSREASPEVRSEASRASQETP